MKRLIALFLLLITLLSLASCEEKAKKSATSSAISYAQTAKEESVSAVSSLPSSSSETKISSSSISKSVSTLSSTPSVSSEAKKNTVYFIIKTHEKTVFESSTTEIMDGAKVFDVLGAICKENNITLDAPKSFGSAYVRAIDGLAEKAVNAQSGWVYRVNGVKPSVGCSSYKLKGGDRVEWLYTLNLGKDAE